MDYIRNIYIYYIVFIYILDIVYFVFIYLFIVYIYILWYIYIHAPSLQIRTSTDKNCKTQTIFEGDVNQKDQKKLGGNDFLKGTLGGWTEQSKVFGNRVISGDSRLAICFSLFPDLFTWKPVNLRDPNQSAGQMQETKQSSQLVWVVPWKVCRVNNWISKAHPSTLPRQSK